MTRILVIWPVHRKDWVDVFQKLSEEFELIFLAGIAKDDDIANYAAPFARCVYWNEYSSVGGLLRDINPNKLVFMSLDNGLNVVLNYLAKQQKLTTYILQHGIYTNYKDYRNREILWNKNKVSENIKAGKKAISFSTLRFIRNSLTWKSFYLIPQIAVFTYFLKKKGPYWAAKHWSFSAKKPTYYLCFSPYNATIHFELDKISPKRIIYTGSPELDGYLEPVENKINGKYYLHIDQAFAENSFGEETVSKNNMIDFYQKLNEFCKRSEAQLYIKLHPESYNSTWLPKDENIVYLKNVSNFNDYIQSAIGCFGFYSTMIIPAIYWKPTVLFKIFYSGLQEKIEETDAAKCYDFRTFEVDQINFNNARKGSDNFVSTFFYQPDGKSLERMKNVLKK